MRPRLSSVLLDGHHIDSVPPSLSVRQPNRLVWGLVGIALAVIVTGWLTGARFADRPELIKDSGSTGRQTRWLDQHSHYRSGAEVLYLSASAPAFSSFDPRTGPRGGGHIPLNHPSKGAGVVPGTTQARRTLPVLQSPLSSDPLLPELWRDRGSRGDRSGYFPWPEDGPETVLP